MKSPANSKAPLAPPIPARRAFIAALITLTLAFAGTILFFFDPRRNGFYPACLFHKLTGLNCPGCGGLRAVHHLTHGNLVTAFHCNPLLIVLLPVLAFTALRWLIGGREAFGNHTVFFRPTTLWTLLFVTLVFTILRNLPGPAFAWMSP